MIALSCFLLSFLISYVGTACLLKVRVRGGFVDVPNQRSSHEVPKPRFGGIAIVGAFFAVYVILLFSVPQTISYLPFAIGAMLLFAVGVVDDWRGLPASMRFGVQVAAALIIVATGGVVDHIRLPMAGEYDLGVLSGPLTVLFILVSVNFYNFIDGIDGLAAGSAFIAAAFLSLIAYMLGHTPLALFSLVAAGAALGFLQFNFPPSRLFMGDAGSTFLGFFFAYVAITGNRLTPEVPFFIPVLILSSLFLDAALTLVKRGLKGERIFDAHHTHYYQRLLSLGLNHKQVTILEYALTVMLGISAIIYFKAGGLFLVFLTLCWIVIFTALILKIRSLERGDRLFWEKRTLLVVAVDLLLITLSYMGAYFLRLNFRFTHPEGVAMLKAFPIVLVVRSACFYWHGLYRGVWKYTSTEDLLKIIKAVTTGSAIILTSVVLLYRFVAFPRSLFIIEYFLLIVTIGGARFAFRVFHEFGKEAHGADAKRIAIIGAGDRGDQVAREIKNSDGAKVHISCFVDDDREKIGLTLRGHPILGPIDRIREICSERRIDAIVVAAALPEERFEHISGCSRESGIPIDMRIGGPAHGKEDSTALFERLGDAVSRAEQIGGRALERSSEVEAFFKGRSVLVAGGGTSITPRLVLELVRLGAFVTVQVAAPAEAVEYGGALGERVPVFIGGLDRPTDLMRLIDASAPVVVFLCIALDRPTTPNALNEQEYFWRRVVRESEALVRGLEGRHIVSFNGLVVWGETRVGSTASYAGATAETVILNAEEISAASTAVIRLPMILTERSLADLMDRRWEGAVGKAKEFDLLETEAVAVALEAAARSRKRALYVPRSIGSFSTETVRRVLSDPVGRWSSPMAEQPQAPRTLLFPAETPSPSRISLLQEVVGPIFPARRKLLDAASRLAIASKPEARIEAIADFEMELAGRISVGTRSPVK